MRVPLKEVSGGGAEGDDATGRASRPTARQTRSMVASLYFALAGAIGIFRYLKVSLALVLALVGAKKMLAHAWLKSLLGPDFNLLLLLVVLGILAAGVLASWLRPARSTAGAS